MFGETEFCQKNNVTDFESYSRGQRRQYFGNSKTGVTRPTCRERILVRGWECMRLAGEAEKEAGGENWCLGALGALSGVLGAKMLLPPDFQTANQVKISAFRVYNISISELS